jgi:triosephosphate isomerase (TIM)
MSRRKLIAGNWKLHNGIADALALAEAVRAASTAAKCEVVIAPVFTAVHAVAQKLAGSHVGVSAQDVYWEAKGAFTGEVSAAMLKDAGATWCIVGHSERRQFFGETDETVRKKVRALLTAGVKPIVCVGESLEQREQGATLGVTLGQVLGSLAGFSNDELASTVIAYEPVWAIGTGKTATPEDAQAVHAAIRAQVAHERGADFAVALRILYGGSVKADNAQALLGQADIDGALVGGASLVVAQFGAVISAAG